MIPELANAREMELRAAAYTIEHRRQWEQIQAIDRLERALQRARERFAAGLGRAATQAS